MISVALHQYHVEGRVGACQILFEGYITSVSSKFLTVEQEDFVGARNLKGINKSCLRTVRYFQRGRIELEPYLARRKNAKLKIIYWNIK